MGRPRARRDQVSIPQVARAAGVSTATAGRALGNYGSVSQQAREKVLSAAAELGYQRNDLARAIITGRSDTIGLVVADIENPFFAAAVRGVSDAARAGGFEVLLSNTDEDPDRERSAVDILLAKQVDGLVVAPTAGSTEHLVRAQRSGCPVVLLDRRLENVELDMVLVDNFRASSAVVAHLAQAGHRRIAMVTGGTRASEPAAPGQRGVSTGRDRVEGFLRGMLDAGIPDPQRYLRTAAGTPEQAHAVTTEMLALPEPPTALFASDSRVALGALRAIREAPLRVPEDISLVAFDDADWTGVVTPSVTVVSQPAQALGYRAGEILIGRIAGSEELPRNELMSTVFIERNSVGPPRAW
ncbi:LacI family transcriptional regulator [Georgenia sp. TF02-10]|uniref:LacI family DNA-binding transcriptional regulator n=1 Tax=Georgenia sp. TF02-10 TaxID=2917725 RepID=UPI001FA7C8F7|nr:LacI family DNA-binding transcriptional regulator [Georgenia sp. TF02-10]UNX54940.1 LacI family transcriptional regulator [Georgenia sp. TF02-10]